MKINIGKYPTSGKTKRKIAIKIEPFDTWNMDHTLALIIHPMLIQLREATTAAPFVEDEDVPENLRRSEEEEE